MKAYALIAVTGKVLVFCGEILVYPSEGKAASALLKFRKSESHGYLFKNTEIREVKIDLV